MFNVQGENHAEFWVRGPCAMTEISKDCSIAGLPGLSSILGTKQGTDGWYIDPMSQKVGFFLVRAVGDWGLLHGPYEKGDLLVRTSTPSLHLSAMHVRTLRAIRSSSRYNILLLSYQNYVRELKHALAHGGEFVDTENVPISFKEAIRRAAMC